VSKYRSLTDSTNEGLTILMHTNNINVSIAVHGDNNFFIVICPHMEAYCKMLYH